jgi:hypothetical protein
MKTYHLDSELTEGKFKGKTVLEALNEDKKFVLNMIKKYKCSFDDEVLKEAGIVKIVHEHTFTNTIVEHDKPKPNAKKLKKDKKSIDEILDEMYDERMNIKDCYETDENFSSDINNIEMPIEL